MKHPWIAYTIVALLAAGAGVAIAGMPDNDPVAATIVVRTIADDASTTVPGTSATTTAAPETTSVDTTESATTAPNTTEPDTTEPGTTDADPSEAGPLPSRGELVVVVANGSGINGAAATNVVRLEALGYADLQALNGTEQFEFTIIYYADGFEDAALRLADDLDVIPDFVAPLADAPVVVDLPADVQLLTYIGVDRAR
jgi:hypothetical protein